MMNIYQLLDHSVKQNASDLHLCAGHLPVARVNGDLRVLEEEPLEPEALSSALMALLNAEQQRRFWCDRQLNVALSVEGVRLRANLFLQFTGVSAALRIVNDRTPTLGQLGVPPALASAVTERDGLIIVCGATGTGKSTTLAALIGEMNKNQARHVITLEDPIEFIHRSEQSLVQQREIGVHAQDFSSGLLAALRQDPDVILLGELRDVATLKLALTAAETGHLVLATLHTRSAAMAVERIVDAFPAGDKRFVSFQLANALKVVACQHLLPGREGGRVAAYEVLVNTPAVANLIREEKCHQIGTQMQTGSAFGMQTMEQCMTRLRAAGMISG